LSAAQRAAALKTSCCGGDSPDIAPEVLLRLSICRTGFCYETHAVHRVSAEPDNVVMKPLQIRAALLISMALVVTPAGATDQDLMSLDLRALMDMDVRVTSVSKKETRLADSAAAITVITPEDIRRLGITSIPEALRLVPGLDVARIDAGTWAISSRGFNAQYANKLLVLIDGRSVYTPAFGGVFWDSQAVFLEDLERIEVIRGPGATLWGANAVNGVINIITKSAKDTHGALLTTEVGSEETPAAGLRYGGELGGNLHYRAYARYVNGHELVDSAGNDAPDDNHSIRGGFRADWDRSENDRLTLQSDYYALRNGESVFVPSLVPPFGRTDEVENASDGANLIGRWTRRLSDVSHVSVQAYVDYFHHESGLTVEARDTADIQMEHRFDAGRHDLMWGLGYRLSADEFNDSALVTWTPRSRDLHLYTLFAQDEITLVPGRLSATLGSKFEHNDYTGFEVQPSARLRYTPGEHHTYWASVSRAVSTPARIHRGSRMNFAAFQPSPFEPPIQVSLIGASDVESETLNAYEIGYRAEPTQNVSLDIAAFYNTYKDVAGVVPGPTVFEATPAPPHVLVTQNWANSIQGNTYGAEATLQWAPVDRLRLTASYSLLKMNLNDVYSDSGSPQQQASVRSYLRLPRDLELNVAAYFVDSVDTLFGGDFATVEAYVRLDTGLVWHPTPSLEAGLWGRNLLDSRHMESTGVNTTFITEVPRTVMARLTWRF
jgi:iron complex outermembrane receptor protein